MAKYFKRMPPGFTKKYFFEIDQGVCTMRHLCTTPDSQAETFSLVQSNNVELIRQALIRALFPNHVEKSLKGLSIDNMQLPCKALGKLTVKKLRSLSKKYFSIPVMALPYYQAMPNEVVDEDAEDVVMAAECSSQTQSQKKRALRNLLPWVFNALSGTLKWQRRLLLTNPRF